LIYFDAFAGSGEQPITQKALTDNLLSGCIEQNELSVYKGAAERVLNISQKGFDYYYFIDKNKKSNDTLANKLKTKFSNQKDKLNFRAGDANEYIKKLASTMSRNNRLKALVLLDPFGMQVNWESISSLSNTSVDLWVLIPTGVVLNRLLDKKYKLVYIEKLISFFGLNEDEIRKYFYMQTEVQTLFGEERNIQKISEPINKIASLYIKRLKTIFKEVLDKPLEMKNSKNAPIYHFAFASNNKTAKKIAADIVGKKQ
jgi:three-Cys-motif partner protein